MLLISLLTTEAIAPAKHSVVSLSISGDCMLLSPTYVHMRANNYCIVMILYTTMYHNIYISTL